jgi:hypothetical protein
MTSPDLVNWTYDTPSSGFEWLASMDVIGVPGTPKPLTVNPTTISAWFGGTANFSLNGGPDLAGRAYGLFGTVSGTTPGFPLPGGGVLPINWDWYTYLLYFISLAPGNGITEGFIGALDKAGYAEATLTCPGHCQLFDDILSNYAWTTNYPWEFQSNPVELLITGAPVPPPEYVYDDGSCENLLGWTDGGEICFMHPFDSGVGDTIEKVSNVYGSTTFPGYGPGNGAPTTIYIWDDPTNDNDPSDAVLLDSVTSTIQNQDLDIFMDTAFTSPVAVTGVFFVGVSIDHSAGMFVCPLDMDNVQPGKVWYAGTPGLPGGFDPVTMTNNTVGEYTTGVWLLRAVGQ